MSQLTTHVLDVAAGKPASGIKVTVEKSGKEQEWNYLANGMTNADGRILDLFAKDKILDPGNYRLTFETNSYFKNQSKSSFYPFIQIVFEITDAQHYHVPLLLSPFGFTTYRGS